MMNKHIKPCPFCGGKAQQGSTPAGNWTVSCQSRNCLYDKPKAMGHTEVDSIQNWNARAGDDLLKKAALNLRQLCTTMGVHGKVDCNTPLYERSVDLLVELEAALEGKA